ncbi:Small integral membrane protein 13-like [Homarus americanus]|uniref:Small integral membrane protein 13-like n=1 Tax=Homarus americanus TaxID=6706 RepID=A0A8J5K3L7_HOMAM|nr:Small integral membrane protein 13-like [Homarus americanus]
MEIKELIISWVSVLAFILLIVFFIACGWYMVWKCFLSKFSFIRELLGKQQEVSPSVEELKQARTRPSRKVRRD